MKYCKRCLYPINHPLGIILDQDGICSGCRIHEEKDKLDWNKRSEKLKKILLSYKNKSDSNYDCIIPVSGARDSYFIVHTIKKVYGMNPLLVTYNKQFNTDVGIRNLSYLRTIFDCDLLTMTVNPDSVKKITRATLQKIGSIYWHCLAGQTVFPVQIAVRLKIPLIIWGAHQGIDQVGMFSHLDEVEMTRKYRKDHDLMGFEIEDLAKNFPELTKKDIQPFLYPHDKEIERIGVRGIYLNNFIRWDSKNQHEKMIEAYGYESDVQTRTFDTYNDVDCYNYSDVHDYIKFLKFGYGKVTDHACREIRLGHMTRKTGIRLVNQYQSKKPKNLDLFLKWLGLTEKGFYFFIDRLRDPQVWSEVSFNNWKLLDNIQNHMNEKEKEGVKLILEKYSNFILTKPKTKIKKTPSYILLGKGYIID